MANDQGNLGAIQDIRIEEEIKTSYLTYSMSNILSRALPDVRDGLKPSQRRIIVAMNDLSLGPRSKYRKCAKIAGDTSGNYHPHGESVIYPTLVRMAQPFNMRYMLVDGQGNFGSIDGDPPAAMRYTEARMTSATMEMLEDLERETVDYTANYDESRTEPTVLPGKFPNLLCNGTTGIAVGMATNIPPHNVGEVCEAIVKVIKEPDVTVDELMEIVKGPDFPTGGILRGGRGMIDAYRNGRGIVTIEGRAGFETKKNGRVSIIITELPYQLNKVRLIEKIAELVKDGRLEGISDVRDESDRDGIRLVVELKKGEDENVVYNQLLQFTPLRDSFGINMIGVLNNRPEQLSLKQLIQVYINHRFEVIRRRTQYQLRKAEEEAHIKEGLLKAIDHIDEIIKLIRSAPTVEVAKEELISRFTFSPRQAQAILDMRLARLTALERDKLQAEYDELLAKIKEYRLILAKDDLVFDIIIEDTHEMKEKYGDKRRTEIVTEEVVTYEKADLIAEEQVVVSISQSGYIKRMPLTTYRRQGRGGKGVIGADLKDEDFIKDVFICSTHDYLCFFTNTGKIHWLKVYDIPALSRQSKGRPLINVLEIKEGETVSNMIPVRDFDQRMLVFATRDGVIKKTPLEDFGRPQRGGIWAIKLDDGDELVGVNITSGNDDIMLGTADGFAIRFNETEVKPQGRATRGMRGIKLRKGDRVVDMIIVKPGGAVLSVCENGYGKRTEFDDYRPQGRGGMGMTNIKTSERNGKVVAMQQVQGGDDLILMTQGGQVVRITVDEISIIGRATQGVRLISFKEDDKLISVARISKEDVEAEKRVAADPKAPDESAEAVAETEVAEENPESGAAETDPNDLKDGE